MSCASLGQSLFEPTTALDLSWKIGSSSDLKCDELDGGTLGDPGLFAKSEDMNFALLGCFQLRGMGSPAFLADIVHDSLLERRSSLAVSHAMTQISMPCTLSADCIPAKTIAAARSTRLSHSPSKRSVSVHGACATSSAPQRWTKTAQRAARPQPSLREEEQCRFLARSDDRPTRRRWDRRNSLPAGIIGRRTARWITPWARHRRLKHRTSRHRARVPRMGRSRAGGRCPSRQGFSSRLRKEGTTRDHNQKLRFTQTSATT